MENNSLGSYETMPEAIEEAKRLGYTSVYDIGNGSLTLIHLDNTRKVVVEKDDTNAKYLIRYL